VSPLENPTEKTQDLVGFARVGGDDNHRLDTRAADEVFGESGLPVAHHPSSVSWVDGNVGRGTAGVLGRAAVLDRRRAKDSPFDLTRVRREGDTEGGDAEIMEIVRGNCRLAKEETTTNWSCEQSLRAFSRVRTISPSRRSGLKRAARQQKTGRVKGGGKHELDDLKLACHLLLPRTELPVPLVSL
jgi:hypothetical protein